jgi:hypothetical protein
MEYILIRSYPRIEISLEQGRTCWERQEILYLKLHTLESRVNPDQAGSMKIRNQNFVFPNKIICVKNITVVLKLNLNH